MAAAPGRLVGLDAARGTAVLGMLWAHFAADGTSDGLADGRSSILFAVVAGVSLGLLTGGADPPPRGDRWRSRVRIGLRGFWLIVFGRMLWALGTQIAVILDSYGALFLVLLPVLFARRWLLAVLVAASAIGGAAIVQAVGPDWNAAFGDPDPLHWPAEWFVTGFYPGLVFAAHLLTGLLAARSGLGRLRTQVAMLAAGAVASAVGYTVAAVSGVEHLAHSDTTWEVLGSGGLAVALTGALLLVCRLAPVAAVLTPIVAAGAMPLTIYAAQVVVLALVQPVLPLVNGYRTTESWPLLSGLAVASCVFAVLWRRLLGSGPLERLMARITVAQVGRPEPPGGGAPYAGRP